MPVSPSNNPPVARMTSFGHRKSVNCCLPLQSLASPQRPVPCVGPSWCLRLRPDLVHDHAHAAVLIIENNNCTGSVGSPAFGCVWFSTFLEPPGKNPVANIAPPGPAGCSIRRLRKLLKPATSDSGTATRAKDKPGIVKRFCRYLRLPPSGGPKVRACSMKLRLTPERWPMPSTSRIERPDPFPQNGCAGINVSPFNRCPRLPTISCVSFDSVDHQSEIGRCYSPSSTTMLNPHRQPPISSPSTPGSIGQIGKGSPGGR